MKQIFMLLLCVASALHALQPSAPADNVAQATAAQIEAVNRAREQARLHQAAVNIAARTASTNVATTQPLAGGRFRNGEFFNRRALRSVTGAALTERADVVEPADVAERARAAAARLHMMHHALPARARQRGRLEDFLPPEPSQASTQEQERVVPGTPVPHQERRTVYGLSSSDEESDDELE